MTYLDTINKIKILVEQHPQLAQFGYGYLSDIRINQNTTEVAGQYITNAVDYPYVFLVPNPHKLQNNQKIYSFNMIVMDQLAVKETEIDGMANYLKVQSDCELYVTDLLAQMYFSEDKSWFVSNIGQITTFKERFDDWVAGVTATIEITIPGGLNACDVPY
jgi:hypothetical protein